MKGNSFTEGTLSGIFVSSISDLIIFNGENCGIKCLMLRNIFLRKDRHNLRHSSLDIIIMSIFQKFDDKTIKNDFDRTI
jgi:hypothetical protein